MQDLRQAVIKLAHDVPEMRKHLVPILRKTGSVVAPTDAQHLMDAIQKYAKQEFPGGTFSWRTSGGLNGNPAALFIQFTTQGKQDWANGIINNDPSHTQWWIHDAFTNAGLLPVLKITMSQGGKVYGPHFTNAQKVGWRDKTGTPDQLLNHMKAYFMKLRMVYDTLYPKG